MPSRLLRGLPFPFSFGFPIDLGLPLLGPGFTAAVDGKSGIDSSPNEAGGCWG